MKILQTITTPDTHDSPAILTIGNFDGVHRGHQQILSKLVNTANQRHAHSVVLTFSNHPATVLRPSQPACTLCTHEHKLRLLEQASIDFVYALIFTLEFAQQTPEEFLQKLRSKIPFDHLILGNDATIGNQRAGNQEVVRGLARTMGFEVEYIDDYVAEGQRISSSLIRGHINQGELKAASALLGRPYSIYAPVIKGAGRGASLGAHTANIDVKGLCLPPLGVYVVKLLYNGESYRGVANLGKAPTIRQNDFPVLEVHLLDANLELYGEFVEVVLHEYLRPEKRFDNVSELKEQIALDIAAAKLH